MCSDLSQPYGGSSHDARNRASDCAELAGVGHTRRLRPFDDHEGWTINRLDQLHTDHVRVDLAGGQDP
jgi:hypothetical protein